MQPQISPGQRKGIDRAVTAQQDLPRIGLIEFRCQLATLAGSTQQGLPDALHIFRKNRIVHIVGVAVQFTRNPVAQAALRIGGHVGAVTQVRQRGTGRAATHTARLSASPGGSAQC
jgi:hypothetical protein